MNLTLRDVAFAAESFRPKGLQPITYTLTPNSFRNTEKSITFPTEIYKAPLVVASYYVSGTVYLLSYSHSLHDFGYGVDSFDIYTSSLNDPFTIGYSQKKIPVSEIHTDPIILGNKIWIWGSDVWYNTASQYPAPDNTTQRLWTASMCWTASTSDPTTWGQAGSYRYRSPIAPTDTNPPVTTGQFIFQSGSVLWWIFGWNKEAAPRITPPYPSGWNPEYLLPTKTYTASISNPLKWHITSVTTSIPYVYISQLQYGYPSFQLGNQYVNKIAGNLFQINDKVYIFPARQVLSQNWVRQPFYPWGFYPQYGYSSSIAYAPISDMSKWQTASYLKKDESYMDNFVAIGNKLHQIGGYSYVTQSGGGNVLISNAVSGTFVVSASSPTSRFRNDGLLPNGIGDPKGKGIASSTVMVLPYSGSLWAVIYGGYSTDSGSNTGSSDPYNYTQGFPVTTIYAAPITTSRGSGEIINYGITPSWKAIGNHL